MEPIGPWVRLFCYDTVNCLQLYVLVLRQDRDSFLVQQFDGGAPAVFPDPAFPFPEPFWIRANVLRVDLPPECI